MDTTRERWPEAVEALGKELSVPRDCAAVLVLPPDAYSLLLVEPPDVPDAELRDALRWRIQDLISFPAADANLDVFAFPEEAQRGRRMAFVAAARRADLVERVQAALAAKLRVSAIDIAELAWRNLIEAAALNSVAVLQVQDDVGVIAVVKQDRLFLSRRLEVRDGASARSTEAVLLQIQRSLDYFDSQLGQGAADLLLVDAPANLCGAWIPSLQGMLPLPVLTVDEWLPKWRSDWQIPRPMPDGAGAAVLGAALRNQTAAALAPTSQVGR